VREQDDGKVSSLLLVIEFGPRIPDGALPVDHGVEACVRERVEALARHAYDGKTLLVPGISEAQSDDEALEAAQRFRDILERKRRRLKNIWSEAA
jgi:hypothetical protein